ncbi:MAG: hypothetical protein WAZ18_02050 [Alphaproteobacteria bacterium]
MALTNGQMMKLMGVSAATALAAPLVHHYVCDDAAVDFFAAISAMGTLATLGLAAALPMHWPKELMQNPSAWWHATGHLNTTSRR